MVTVDMISRARRRVPAEDVHIELRLHLNNVQLEKVHYKTDTFLNSIECEKTTTFTEYISRNPA
jgi:hypothetical protein